MQLCKMKSTKTIKKKENKEKSEVDISFNMAIQEYPNKNFTFSFGGKEVTFGSSFNC